MPIYPKSRGAWRVVVFHEGRRVDRVIRGKKREAEEFEARLRLDLRAGTSVENRVAPTFSDFCVTQYAPYAQLHLKPTTWKNRTYQIANLAEHFGALRLTKIRTDEVVRFARARVAAGRKPATVNNELKVLAAILAYAREIDVPCATPKMRKLKQRKRRQIESWTQAEVGRLYAACGDKAPDILPLVVCAANTGMRRGEIIALRSEDVDLQRRVIVVQASRDEDWSPKSERWREVPVNDVLLEWFTPERLARPWVFPCPSTGRRYAYWPQRKFDRSRDAANLQGGPHILRHTYASHLVLATRDLLLVARILGHSHERVTELYAHLLPDHLSAAREALCFRPPHGPDGS